jgi:hypothetical protein
LKGNGLFTSVTSHIVCRSAFGFVRLQPTDPCLADTRDYQLACEVDVSVANTGKLIMYFDTERQQVILPIPLDSWRHMHDDTRRTPAFHHQNDSPRLLFAVE